MLFARNNREGLENLNKLVPLQDQVKAVRLQEKLGKQNFHEDMKEVFEPMTDAIKNASENITKSITESSVNNHKGIENLNEKILNLMNDKGMIAPCLASSLVNFFKPENKSQFKLIKGQKSIRMNDSLINGGIAVSFCSNMITFRDSNKSFKLDGDLLETMTNYVFNVNHANQQDRKLIYEFGKERMFDIEQKGRKSNRDKSMIKLIESPAIMVSGISKTIFLSSDPDELCNKSKFLLQEKYDGKISDINNDEIFAIVDNLLGYKCIS